MLLFPWNLKADFPPRILTRGLKVSRLVITNLLSCRWVWVSVVTYHEINRLFTSYQVFSTGGVSQKNLLTIHMLVYWQNEVPTVGGPRLGIVPFRYGRNGPARSK